MSDKKNLKSIVSWCLYDWANTAFGTVIITFIFSVYFTREIAETETQGSAQWSFAIAASGLGIAILAPLLGAITDHIGQKKKWIFIFSMICIAATTFLWLAVPGMSALGIIFILSLVAVANLGLELAQVFYNATLKDIALPKMVGRMSGWAWGVGYLGGLTALVCVLLLFIGLGDMKPLLTLGTDNFENIRISAPFIALWFFVFMLPFFLFVPETKKSSLSWKEALVKGVNEIKDTIKNFRHHKNLLTFIISSAIYRDGLITLFAIGGVYAAAQFGMNFTEILIFAIGLNVTAAIGAISFAFMDDFVGSKKTIIVSLLGLIIVGCIVLVLEDKNIFILFSLLLGIFIGPAQAASRTMVTKICPDDMLTQGYGFYAFSGKSISFLGPFLYGVATTIFQTQQAGMVTIILFWLIGLMLLYHVKEKVVV
ncbi:MAG: MFS transporter [Pseudomonadota bacterium]